MSKKALIKGAGLVSAAEMLSRVISFSSFAALAIWLTPEDYGVFAIAWLAFIFADSLFDMGTGVSYYKDATDNPKAFNLYCGVVLILGTFWLAVMGSLSGVFAAFDNTHVAEALGILTISLIPRVFSTPYSSAWIREGKYYHLMANKVLGAVAGSVAAIWAAYEGWGDKALAVRFFVAGTASLILVLFTRRLAFVPAFDLEVYRGWFARGLKFSVTTNWGWLVFMYIEQQAVLHIFGTAALGMYTYVKKVVEVGMQVISSIARSVILPAFFNHKFSANVVILTVFKMVIPIVFLCGLAWLGADWVIVYVPEEWQASALLLTVLVFLLPIELGNSILGAYLISKDKYAQTFMAEVFSTLGLCGLAFTVYAFALPLSAIAAAVLMATVLRFLVLLVAMVWLREQKANY